MPQLNILLLGPIQVFLTGQRPLAFPMLKSLALLVYLAMAPGHTHARSTLASLLWPDFPDEAARTSLRQALKGLRQLLDDGQAAEPVLLVTAQTVQFNPACDLHLDVTAFNRLCTACTTHRHRRSATCSSCIQRLHQALTLYRGDFLGGFYLRDSSPFEEWASLQREALRREAGLTCGTLAEHYDRQGDAHQLEWAARRQLELEPWNEAGHRHVMLALAASGRRNAALVHFDAFQQALAAEVGVLPEPATLRLSERLAQPSLPSAEQPAAAWLSPPPLHNFPPMLTPFIGREPELAALSDLLQLPGTRLVTVCGPGGMGKTRLAQQVAQREALAFRDGAAFVPLAAVLAPEYIAPAIAEAMGLSLAGAREPLAQLLTHLSAKELLLVLDNFEHLLSPVADRGAGATELIVATLRALPGLTLLVTSREPLDLQVEQVYGLAGLPLEAAALEPPCASAQLFAERAGRVWHGWQLDQANSAAVSVICRLVDGLPLGIELAAALVRQYEVAEIAIEIARTLDVLTSQRHDLPARHRSLRAVFEHTWQRLAWADQQTLRQLSVFQGSFETGAAQQVAGATSVQLAALVEATLLRAAPGGRLELHEALRQFAEMRLLEDPAEAEVVRSRHAAFYAGLLQQFEAPLRLARAPMAVRGISIEIQNIRSAWRWATAHTQVEILAQAAEALFLFYETRGWLHEGDEAFAQAGAALALASTTANDRYAEVGAALHARQGALCHALSDYARARAILQQSLTQLQAVSANADTAIALRYLGWVAFTEGQYTEAQTYFEENLALCRRTGNALSEGDTLYLLALVAYELSNFAQARQICAAALELCQAHGYLWGMLYTGYVLGSIMRAVGQYTEAERLHQETYSYCRQGDFIIGAAWALINLGVTARAQHQFAKAGQLAGEALVLCRQAFNRWGIAHALKDLGLAGLGTGDHAAAQVHLAQALGLYEELGDHDGTADCLNGQAQLAQTTGDRGGARQLFRAALRHTQASGCRFRTLDVLVGLAGALEGPDASTRAANIWTLAAQHPSSEHWNRERAARRLAERGHAEPWPAADGHTVEGFVAHELQGVTRSSAVAAALASSAASG